MSGDFSIWQGILHAALVVKVILLLLIVLSLGTWSVFFQKVSSLELQNSRNVKFDKKFWSGIMLEEFYQEIKAGKFKSYYGDIFSAAMEEWTLSDVTKEIMAVEFIKVGIRERISLAIDATKHKMQKQIYKGMDFLSSVASISPFIGLLGTVWGVMNSFSSLASLSSVTLSAVAPGIAEALFSTAVGLFVALPALALHAMLTVRINALNADIDRFGLDMVNVLSRELDAFSVKNYTEANRR